MGGPDAGVFLRSCLTEQQLDDLSAWLRNNTVDLQIATLTWEFLTDGHTFGVAQGGGTEGLRSLAILVQEPELEDHEREQIISCIGFDPQQELIFCVMSKGELEHQILGHLAVFLAERYNGVVDFGNEINRHRMQDWEPRLKAIPGKVIEVVCPSEGSGGGGYYHVVNGAVMRGWLKHTEFHMVN